MSGIIISVIPPTFFTFTPTTSSTFSVTMPIASRVDLTGYDSGALVVRVSTMTFTAAGGTDTLTVNVLADGWDADNPNLDFSATGTNVATKQYASPQSGVTS